LIVIFSFMFGLGV